MKTSFEYPPLEKIEVTVYGMKKNSYEAATRVPGSYEAAWRGINLLLEKKIPFVVKGALLPSNKNEMPEFKSWAETIPWMDKPPSYSMFFDLRCRRDGQKNQAIKSLRLSAEEGLKILTRDEDGYIKGMKEFCSKFMRPSGDKIFACGAGNCGGCVDAYGKFQLCSNAARACHQKRVFYSGRLWVEERGEPARRSCGGRARCAGGRGAVVEKVIGHVDPAIDAHIAGLGQHGRREDCCRQCGNDEFTLLRECSLHR